MANAWLLLSHPESDSARPAAWSDETGVSYHWDSRVPYHSTIAEGDLIAIRDRYYLLGISIIQDLRSAPGVAEVLKCPSCEKSRIKSRATKTPTYKCYESACRAEFDEPLVISQEVTEYLAIYTSHWVGLPPEIPARELKQYSDSGQNSMKPLQWEQLARRIAGFADDEPANRLAELSESVLREPGIAAHESYQGMVRLRRGQASFRNRLLEDYGPVCFITGRQPPEVLDAAHLYSYAEVQEHKLHGGILLRKDLHELFDRLMLSVNPDSKKVVVGLELSQYTEYAALDGSEIKADIRPAQREWFTTHFEEFKTAENNARH